MTVASRSHRGQGGGECFLPVVSEIQGEEDTQSPQIGDVGLVAVVVAVRTAAAAVPVAVTAAVESVVGVMMMVAMAVRFQELISHVKVLGEGQEVSVQEGLALDLVRQLLTCAECWKQHSHLISSKILF